MEQSAWVTFFPSSPLCTYYLPGPWLLPFDIYLLTISVSYLGFDSLLFRNIIFKCLHVPYFSNPGIYSLQSSQPVADRSPGYPYCVVVVLRCSGRKHVCKMWMVRLVARVFLWYLDRSSVDQGRIIHRRATEKCTKLGEEKPHKEMPYEVTQIRLCSLGKEGYCKSKYLECY